jgi:hypothetical protein
MPSKLRTLLKHPVLPDESRINSANRVSQIDFKDCHINSFSLKYLAKFISSQSID